MRLSCQILVKLFTSRIINLGHSGQQFAYNWIYDKAGNSPNGTKADKIGELDSIDKIYIQGATDDQLTFAEGISHATPFGDVFSGIGIYAGGTLGASYARANHLWLS